MSLYANSNSPGHLVAALITKFAQFSVDGSDVVVIQGTQAAGNVRSDFPHGGSADPVGDGDQIRQRFLPHGFLFGL